MFQVDQKGAQTQKPLKQSFVIDGEKKIAIFEKYQEDGAELGGNIQENQYINREQNSSIEKGHSQKPS